MPTPKPVFSLYVQLAVVLVAVYVVGLLQDIPTVRLIAKPLVCVFLAFSAVTAPYSGEFGTGLALALLSSALGDFLLEYKQEFFLYGLGAFAVAHLLFARAFATSYVKKSKTLKPPPVLFVVLSILAAIAVYCIWPSEDVMQVAVVGYSLMIVLMASYASTDTTKTCIGAFLFMASDALIGIRVFSPELRDEVPLDKTQYQLVVMALYWAGQFLLTSEFLVRH